MSVLGVQRVPARHRSEVLDLVVGRNLRWTLIRATAIIVVSVVVFGWVLLPVRTYGVSMEPTYRAGELVFVNALAYRWGKPERGDIVAIELAGPHVVFLKRIVGLPGEHIAFRAGLVLVNGQPLQEEYVRYRVPDWNVPDSRLGSAEYFVVGDNRSMPQQQHEFGKVTEPRLIGKLLF
ncbi:MAG: signal peptidase I [Acidobacteria bacterium]|nr:signal peptidase I [Acidobacteriota bacterium]